jgi:hypothetical protein
MNLNRADVQFSLFHKQTNSQIKLWRGEAKSWSADENPVFTLSCSDSIYELTLPYPARTITRECYKPFSDGRLCPYSSAGSGGDPGYCDKLFDSQNGCQSHGMSNYFGGITATPQGVAIRDNGSDGRPTITATSIVSDTMYGRALQEVYTNIEMPVNCIIADGRDESDFYEAIGIVGAAPIQSFGPVANQLLDGQTQNYPYSPIMVTGNDPNSVPFSLDAGGNFQYPYKAAGVSWISIRRTDEKGIQPSSPDDHQMVASITGGMTGLVWSSPGVNSLQLLTNPIWVAVNALLRSKGMGYGTPIDIQEAQFDVASAVAAAAICDIQTPTLVYNRNPVQLPVDGANVGVGNWTPINGTAPQLPNETQFQFIGVIKDQQPLRDWIDQILLNCLGFWYTAFGRIAFGIRENAGAAEAFTIGSMLFKSYSEQPYIPESGTFNDLTASYADRDYKFAQNTARYYDQDHAISLGSVITPRYEKGQVNLSGTCTASQALRIAATRCRESIGGVNEFEWKSARTASWKTTVLALNTFPGQVVSVTHPDATNGYGKFRIQKWTLNYDYSISITGTTVTDSMYDLDAGPKPADVLPPALPRIPATATNQMPAWCPGSFLRPFSESYNMKSTFRLFKDYQLNADGTAKLTLTCQGYMPVTSYFTNSKPTIRSVTTTLSNGSFIDARWYVSISGIDANGFISAPSDVYFVQGQGTTPGSAAVILLNGVTYPVGSVNFVVFVGPTRDTMTASALGPVAPGTIPVTSQNPTGFGRPPDYWRNVRLRVKVRTVNYLGNYAGTVIGVDSTSFPGRDIIQTTQPVNAGWGDGYWATSYGHGNGEVPIGDYTVGPAFNYAGGTKYGFDIIDALDALHFAPGDLSAIRLTSYPIGTNTATTLYTPPYIDDASSQFHTNALAGKMIRLVGGSGAGQIRQIASNTYNSITVSTPWDIIPSASFVNGQPAASFFIEETSWAWTADSYSIVNPNPNAQITVAVTIPLLTADVYAVIVSCFLTSNGYEGLDEDAPFREILLK